MFFLKFFIPFNIELDATSPYFSAFHCCCCTALPFPASGNPSARIRLCRIDEPRTDSREGVSKNTECNFAMIAFANIIYGNLPFPASGNPSARIWQAILTNRRRIHEKEYQKTPNAKLHSVFFGTPDGNRTHN